MRGMPYAENRSDHRQPPLNKSLRRWRMRRVTIPDLNSHEGYQTVPMLFLQGTRDTFADLKLLRPICAELRPQATLHIIKDADHSFRILKSTRKTDLEVLRELVGTVSAWAEEIQKNRKNASAYA